MSLVKRNKDDIPTTTGPPKGRPRITLAAVESLAVPLAGGGVFSGFWVYEVPPWLRFCPK
ncbi:hypothetical protein CASFOL_004073 [Castilleja foliolosa]|uniref:Uncharacterized protein n=1 Tax=Castilleja foliolosa TaxID=1961234 RepID=A0ABD3EJ12_9LAMI